MSTLPKICAFLLAERQNEITDLALNKIQHLHKFTVPSQHQQIQLVDNGKVTQATNVCHWLKDSRDIIDLAYKLKKY